MIEIQNGAITMNGVVYACDLGTGVEVYFDAYELLQKAGIQKPEYLQLRRDLSKVFSP